MWYKWVVASWTWGRAGITCCILCCSFYTGTSYFPIPISYYIPTFYFFFFRVKQDRAGLLGRVNLGLSGLNLLWVLD